MHISTAFKKAVSINGSHLQVNIVDCRFYPKQLENIHICLVRDLIGYAIKWILRFFFIFFKRTLNILRMMIISW